MHGVLLTCIDAPNALMYSVYTHSTLNGSTSFGAQQFIPVTLSIDGIVCPPHSPLHAIPPRASQVPSAGPSMQVSPFVLSQSVLSSLVVVVQLASFAQSLSRQSIKLFSLLSILSLHIVSFDLVFSIACSFVNDVP